MTKRAFVIAHYDQQGSVRTDLLRLIEKMSGICERMTFVSTNLSPKSRAKVERYCRVIIRLNVGYDFSSYQTGIQSLGDLSEFDEVVIFNSSFICFDPAVLIERFLAFPRAKNQLIGITKSQEYSEHLQSYFVAFPKAVFCADYFWEWWVALQPINKREDVIQSYEIGMSAYFLQHGCTLRALFEPGPEQCQKAVELFRRRYKREPDKSDLNPTHFNWEALLKETGIMKVELLAKNPHRLNLKSFYADYGSRHTDLIQEACKNRTAKDIVRMIRSKFS